MSTKSETMLSIKDISKRFGDFGAVKDVSFSVSSGEIYALIGPNGSGKTTLVKMITNLLLPDKGQIKINGFDVVQESLDAKNDLGYVPDDPALYDYLTGREFLWLTGRLHGMTEDRIKTRISDLLEIFPLKDVIDHRAGEYSRGSKQKVAFLSALISEPKLLVIDEPIVGLDPLSIINFGKELKKFASAGGAVFMTTHILDFAQQWASAVGVLSEGKLTRETKVSRNTDLAHLYQLVERE